PLTAAPPACEWPLLSSCAARQGARAIQERLIDLAPRERTDAAGSVEDEALGELIGPVGVGEVAVGVAQVGVGDVEATREGAGVGRRVQVGDAEDSRAVPRKPLLCPLEQRSLRLAGLTPRGPEVQHDDLSTEGCQRGLSL